MNWKNQLIAIIHDYIRFFFSKPNRIESHPKQQPINSKIYPILRFYINKKAKQKKKRISRTFHSIQFCHYRSECFEHSGISDKNGMALLFFIESINEIYVQWGFALMCTRLNIKKYTFNVNDFEWIFLWIYKCASMKTLWIWTIYYRGMKLCLWAFVVYRG